MTIIYLCLMMRVHVSVCNNKSIVSNNVMFKYVQLQAIINLQSQCIHLIQEEDY